MRPFPDLESSTHTNAPTPQLRKKRIKRMKGQFIVVSSLVLTLPFDMLGLHPGLMRRKLEESLGKMEGHAYTQRMMPSHTQVRNEAHKQNDPYRLAGVMKKG